MPSSCCSPSCIMAIICEVPHLHNCHHLMRGHRRQQLHHLGMLHLEQAFLDGSGLTSTLGPPAVPERAMSSFTAASQTLIPGPPAVPERAMSSFTAASPLTPQQAFKTSDSRSTFPHIRSLRSQLANEPCSNTTTPVGCCQAPVPLTNVPVSLTVPTAPM
jgi:hypothetical protein